MPLHERAKLAGVAVDAVFDSVSVATTFKAKLQEAGVIFCSFSEAVREHPELVRKYLGSVVPVTDNFFATLNSAVFSDGSFVYVPKGVRCPMELSHLLPHQRLEHGAVRAHADRGRRGRLRQLPRGLHRADARREPAARRGRRAGRGAGRADQVLDRAELVPGRQGRQGRHLQLRHEARQVRGRALAHLVDPGGDGLGDHLEVPVVHPAGRRVGGRVLLGGGDEQPPAGRHRHQDDPHRQEHAQHDRLEGHLGRSRPELVPRPREDREGRRRRAQLLAVRLAADRRPVRRPHVPVHRRAELERPDGARGHDLEDLRGPAVLLPVARHRARRTRST